MSENSIAEIFGNFSNLIYPGDDNISLGNSIEAKYVALYFIGKGWHELSVDNLLNDYEGDPSACLSFMTSIGFRYYFPGYMKMALLQYDSADAIFDVVISKLGIAACEPDSDLRRVFEEYNLLI